MMATSDCCLVRTLSAGSPGSANVGELSPLEISVGGVDDRDISAVEA